MKLVEYTPIFLTVLIVLIVHACGSDDTQPLPLDPVGNWSLTVTLGSGDCELTGTVQSSFTVTKEPDKYIISNTDPNTKITGSITCTIDTCKLSATETESISETIDEYAQVFVTSMNLTMDASKAVTGNGSIDWTVFDGSDASCKQLFDVKGIVK